MVMALLAGLAAGRFVTAGGDAAGGTAARTATLGQRLAALERRVAERPDDLPALQQLGALYVLRLTRSGDPAAARLASEAFDRADAVRSDAPRTLVGRGALAVAQHRFAEALELAEQALAARPRNLTAHGVAVDAAVELGRYDEAARRLQDMLDIRPGLAALSRASYLRELNGDLPGAVLAMQQAITAGAGSARDVADSSVLLGDLHFRQGALDRAQQAYERALQLAPGVPRGVVGNARVAAARGEVTDAIRSLEDLVERAPLPEAAILLADLHALAGDRAASSDAVELVRALIRLQQEAGQVVELDMATFEADLGNGATALRLARSAYEARPTIHAADAMAWALLAAGDAEAAVPYLQEASRLGTSDALLDYHAAEVLAAAGQDARAAERLAAAFSLTPWFTFRHRDRAAALAEDLGVPAPEAWAAS